MAKRPTLYLAYLFQFLIAANIFIALSLGEHCRFGGVLALGLTLVPAIVTRRGTSRSPRDQPLVALSLYLHVAGGVRGSTIYYPTTTRSLTSSQG